MSAAEKYGITPGPWKAALTNGRPPYHVDDADGISIVYVGTSRNAGTATWDEHAANARAIAQVPEMIEALERLTVTVNGSVAMHDVMEAASDILNRIRIKGPA